MSQPSLLSSIKLSSSVNNLRLSNSSPVAPLEPFDYFSEKRMYDDVLYSVFSFLNPCELSRISSVTLRFNNKALSSSYLWNQFLRPKAFVPSKGGSQAPHPTAKKLFENPLNRKDRYVPVDKAGLDYLNSLGITNNFLIECIQQDILTIVDVKRSIDSWPLDVLKNAVIRKYIYQKNITLETALRLPLNVIEVLIRPGVQKYTENGKIDIQEYINQYVTLKTRTVGLQGAQGIVFESFLSATYFAFEKLKNLTHLDSLMIQKYIDQGVLSVDDVIRSDFFGCFIERLDEPEIQQHILHGRLTPTEVINGECVSSLA